MKTRTRSATPLAPVMIETAAGITHVWLRKGITQTTDPDSGQDVYEADEVYFFSPESVTLSAVEAEFATLWVEHEDDDLTPLERAQQHVAQLETAIVELADILVGGE